MTLEDRLAALRERPLPTGPERDTVVRARAISADMVADLIGAGTARAALGAGDRAPAFALSDTAGRRRTLAALLTGGPVVLRFFRGEWCPYCREDLAAMRDAAEVVRAAGGVPVAISPQRPAANAATARRFELDLPLLSDTGSALAHAFGIRFEMPGPLVDLYRERFGTDLAQINGDETGMLPMPATFVIGRDQRIRYAELNPDYTRRTDLRALTPVIERLAAAEPN